PVGGIVAKIEGARQAGVKKVLIPKGNWQQIFGSYSDIDVVPVENINSVLQHALVKETAPGNRVMKEKDAVVLSAAPC
ncbi:MAG TPA: ATP-dependent protease LonB, partial [Firmicutes bacterium]|nr:ATP-dependent protease LonB [Bacillota bacterium]